VEHGVGRAVVAELGVVELLVGAGGGGSAMGGRWGAPEDKGELTGGGGYNGGGGPRSNTWHTHAL
jgi:hypothetical protein